MSKTIQVVFPYQWGQLTITAPDCMELDSAVLPLSPDTFCVEPSLDGWAELRARVLGIMATLPAAAAVSLSLKGPAVLTGDDPMGMVRQGLAALGWNQEELARQLGVTSNTVWRWFAGRTPLPPWVTAFLAMALQGRSR